MPSIILPDRGRAPETHEGWKIVQGDGVLEYEVSQCIEKCWRQISAKDQTELQDRAIEEHKVNWFTRNCLGVKQHNPGR
jgi:hypothetical protein